MTIDITKLSKDERGFFTGIVNRLGSGDVKSVGTELLAEFVNGLTTEVFQKGCRLGDVLCQGDYAEAFNSFLTRENKWVWLLCDDGQVLANVAFRLN
jgi:hypothetical protein